MNISELNNLELITHLMNEHKRLSKCKRIKPAEWYTFERLKTEILIRDLVDNYITTYGILKFGENERKICKKD